MHSWEAIQTAIDYIDANIEKDMSPEELADIAALSPFYFQRLFKRLVKRSVGEYIKLRRLARATEVLKDKNRRILDIALEYGFNSHEGIQGGFRHHA